MMFFPRGAIDGGDSGASAPARTGIRPSVYYISVESLPHDRGFTVAGRVPQLRHAGASQAVINARLRDVVEEGILGSEVSVRPSSGPFAGGGEFTITPARSLMSVDSVLVSALLPVTESRPHGTSSPYWLSVTVEVARPRLVRGISAVILASGFRLLAKAARSRLAKNRCVMQWARTEVQTATAPRATSFRQYAMLPTGLAIGFPSKPGGPPYECGSPYVIIPCSALAGVLSPAGRALARGATDGR